MNDMATIEHARVTAAMLSGGVSSPAIYRAVITAALRACPAPSTILDFGSGTGQLLPLLASAYPRAVLHAADIMPRPAHVADAVIWHQGDLNDDAGIHAGSIDLLFAVEVIEHLENPRQMLRDVARLLAPGGVAVLSTPNPHSIRSLITFISRGHHAQFDDSNYPAHITPVSELDFRRIGQETGLVFDHCFHTDHGTIPKLLTRRWQDVPLIGSRLRGRWFSDNYGVVLRKPAGAPA